MLNFGWAIWSVFGPSKDLRHGGHLQVTVSLPVDSTHLLTLNRLHSMRKQFSSLFVFSLFFALAVLSGLTSQGLSSFHAPLGRSLTAYGPGLERGCVWGL